MANVIIKSEVTRQQETAVMRSYGISGRGTPEQREAAAVVVARTKEAQEAGRKGGR
jgi:hypothetical protein